MKLSKSILAKVFSGLLVMGGMAAATSASAQGNDGYDNTAQLLTGLTIGAVAGYALLQAADGFQDVHYQGHSKGDHGGRNGHGHHKHYRGCDHDRGRYYSYKHERYYGYDRGHQRGHYRDHHRDHHKGKKHHREKYHRHNDGYRGGDRHGVYRIKEESYSRRDGYERRVSVTHF